MNPGDYGWLYELFVHPSNLHTWNLRGRVPSYEEFPTLVWDRVLVQFVIVARASNQPIGLASIYSVDFRSRFAKFSLIIDPDHRAVGWSLEGASLVVSYAFKNWDLRKLFIEMLQFNVEASGVLNVNGPFVEEGRYRAFEFYDGRYWDLVIIGLTRDDWERRDLLADRSP